MIGSNCHGSRHARLSHKVSPDCPDEAEPSRSGGPASPPGCPRAPPAPNSPSLNTLHLSKPLTLLSERRPPCSAALSGPRGRFVENVKVSGGSAGSPASSSSVSTSSRQYPRQRITRVNLRDFIFYMEQERETNRSLLLYRALLNLFRDGLPTPDLSVPSLALRALGCLHVLGLVD
ncbi:hypothetical protein AOLI_G00101680 [Acnodon oligacanthus]